MSLEVSCTLQVYEVEYGDDHGGVCVVRCLSGVVRTGQLFLSPTTATPGPAPAVTLTATRIECYGREVPFLDPPHTARVTLSGGPITGLTRGRSSRLLCGPPARRSPRSW